MACHFAVLTRPAIRKLQSGQRITEHGITVESLPSGDLRYSVNIMVDGERIHRVIGRASDGTTRTQAEEFITKARADAKEGRLNLPKGRKLHLIFAAAADTYLKKIEEIDAKDYVNNEQHIRLHLKPYFGTMRLDKISTFTLQKFQKHCREKGIAETTTNRVLATYRRMGRRLAEWKLIPAPPPMVRLRKERNARTYVISDEEEANLLKAALEDSNCYIWLFVKLGLATSLRHSEMLTASFQNFDPERRRLGVMVKGGSWRNQPLPRGITKILEREQEMAEDRDGWIFPSKTSVSGHMESMTSPFARCVAAAGMDASVVTPHVMRHTAITRLAETGAGITTIQEYSGHESLEMVLRYTHAQDRAVDRALDRLERRTIVEHRGGQKTEKS